MIKFEEHEGKLFRMLEEPVQLKEKNTNVLVQFITHGAIGEYVMEHWLDCGQENAPIFVDSVDSDGDVTVFIENGNEHHCCPFPMFEIIGYPVSDGSNEWALYQMMQGEGVCHKKSPSIVYYKHAGGIRLEVRHNHIDYVSIDDWLNRADKDGWQIYKEPEPQYKVGDWVEMDYKGTLYHRQVISVHDNGIRVEFGGATPLISFDGKSGMLLIRLVRKLKPSEVIVHIGCLSGTIGKSCDLDRFLMWHSSPKIDFDYSIIKFSAIDKETRELVESLLEAQEEEK